MEVFSIESADYTNNFDNIYAYQVQIKINQKRNKKIKEREEQKLSTNIKLRAD